MRLNNLNKRTTMIKVEVFKQSDGTTKLVFETRDKSETGLAELDEVYQAVLGSDRKYGGYTNSFTFSMEVKGE